MYKLSLLLLSLSLATLAHAEVRYAKVAAPEINHCLAHPAFAKALLEASEKTNGYKIRINYGLDNTYRTTKESIVVNLVGRSDENGKEFRLSSFTVNAINGCFQITGVSPVEVHKITEKEFVDFEI